jgi:hypothetical protein
MTQCCTLHSPPAASCSTHTILATRAAHHRTAAASTPDGIPCQTGYRRARCILARCNLASCRLRRAGCIVQVVSCRLHRAGCFLRAACVTSASSVNSRSRATISRGRAASSHATRKSTRSARTARTWQRGTPCRMGYDVPACSGVAKSEVRTGPKWERAEVGTGVRGNGPKWERA